ncbi:TBC1 domain family member 24-like isoform X2 [Rhinatrema bivittatum]|uniref:TBC1 domain family member 24-like isoform X2 n=1 Tax=Rhinatrema bivittatum TaxID=194408 RepID=UPI001129FBB0|nr:TBC1 domain family member 24-like isoform X2 [Rhinatrema bivittatum]
MEVMQDMDISADIPVLIIPEMETWDIDTSSYMGCGQFVDWDKIPDSNQEMSTHTEVLPTDQKALKRMAREGHWAHNQSLRAEAYTQIIKSVQCRIVTPDASVYRDVAGRLFGKRSVSSHPLPEFLDDCVIPTYFLSLHGVTAVKKILICIGNQFPDITCSPALPAVVSLLLHYCKDEAECFEKVCRLIACVDTHKCYIDQSFLAYEASCMTFGDLAKKHCQIGYKIIATTSTNISEVYADWLMWIFGDLPFDYAIRVFDVYLIEGYKVLYRIALALLKQYSLSISAKAAEVSDVRQDLQIFVQNITQNIAVEKLLEKAFSIRLFSHKEIWLLQLANRKALSQRGIAIMQRRQSTQMSVDLLNFSSTIVTAQEMRLVWSWIPERFSLFPPVLLFTTMDHGYSLQRFYSHCEGYEPTILLIKTTDDEVRPEMERYEWVVAKKPELSKMVAPRSPRSPRLPRSRSPSPGSPRRSSSPSRPSSLLSSSPGSHGISNYLTVPVPGAADRLSPFLSVRHFQLPSKTASMFMSGSHEGFIIGGGGGQALNIDADLLNGRTQNCETFDNPPLCQETFQVQLLEVWGFQNS